MELSLLLVLLALSAGLLSFVSPCVLPLIPAYVSYITGVSVEDIRRGAGAGRLRALLTSGAFVLGLATIFALLGATASAIGSFLLSYQPLLMRIGGILIILFALHLLGLFRLPFLERDLRFDFVALRNQRYIGAFLMGFAFGAGWTPCIGYFAGALLALASQTQTVWQGTLLLFIYALGLGIPFLLATLAINAALAVLRRVKRYLRGLELASGALLLAMGILLFTGQLTVLSAWFAQVFGVGLVL